MGKRIRIYFTLKGKVLMDFWLGKTSGRGISFGPRSWDSDLHLTVWGSKGKIRYHIRHIGIKEPPDESPLGRQTSTRLVSKKVEAMLIKRLATYRGNKTCWVFTRRRWRKIQSLLPRVDLKGHVRVPLELVFSQLDMDFSNRNLWRKTRIRSLLVDEPRFGFAESKRGRLQLITPVSDNKMLAWPLSRASEIQDYLFEVTGFDEFVDYLAQTDEGKRLLSEVRDQIKRLINT